MRIETRIITSQSQLSALYTELNNASLFWKQGTALEIEFASGTYTLTQPLYISGFPKVTIRGTRTSLQSTGGNVEQVSTLQVTKSFNFTQEDSVINIRGYLNRKVEVEIRDLALKSTITKSELSQLHYSWYIQPTFLFKVEEARTVAITRIETEVKYLDCTNIDLHWCDNVKVRNCSFINYNCRTMGGCLWLRNNVNSAVIANNTFHKYGNDETLAIWIDGSKHVGNALVVNDSTATVISSEDASCERGIENVTVQGNRFYCDPFDAPLDASLLNGYRDTAKATAIVQRPRNDNYSSAFVHERQWDDVMDLHVAIYTLQSCRTTESNVELFRTQHTVRNVKFEYNDFHIDTKIASNLCCSFSRYCTFFENIDIVGNHIDYGAWVMEGHYLIDFEILHDINDETSYNPQMPARVDHVSKRFPVNICSNTIHSKCLPYFNWNPKQESHICLRAGGNAVNFEHNHMEVDTTALAADRATFNADAQGISLVFCHVRTAFVRLRNNVCKNLLYLGSFTKAGASLDNVVMECTGNIFSGYTQINNNQISRQRLYFDRNKFFSTGTYLFLRKVADSSEVVFVNNQIHHEGSGNPTFAYLSTDTPAVGLDVLVCDNVFDNIVQDDSIHDIYSFLRNKPKVTLRLTRNQYAQ